MNIRCTYIRAPTTYTGVFGDLGLVPFWARVGWQTASMWTRVVRAGPKLLIGKAMFLQRVNFTLNNPRWLKYAYGSMYMNKFGFVYK